MTRFRFQRHPALHSPHYTFTSFWAKASTPEKREPIHLGIYRTTGLLDAIEQWQHGGESELLEENQAYVNLEEVRKPVSAGAQERMGLPSVGLSANFVGLGVNPSFGSRSLPSPKRKRPQKVVRAFSFLSWSG
jgi:hypothetical protein